MWLKISTFTLLPALILQGYKVKKNTPKLPEPVGDRSGHIGNAEKLSILIVGDSAAAGVGVLEQRDALSGALITILKDDFLIDWCLYAKTGDDSSKILKSIQTIQDQNYDVVITSIGVNDVTQLISPKKWIRKQKEIYALIQKKFQPKLILASGVPPMHLFPALPNPLAWLSGQYAKQMNLKLKNYIAENPNMQCVEYDMEKFQKLNLTMADDGFHPSKEIYQVWADELAMRIRQQFKSS